MKLSIFDDLIRDGHLTDEQLMECQAEEQESGQPLDRVLRQKGYVTETCLLEVLARRLRIPFITDLTTVEVPPTFCQNVGGT